MTLASGVGSMPGDSQHDLDEALRVVLGELGVDGGLPFLPEVPGRGAVAGMTGRTLGLVDLLDADLQPAGWRLTGTSGAPGVDHRRARSLLAQDLDSLEEQGQGLAGAFKTQVTGPWTMAVTVERPRGDKLVADHGARRELAQALAEGVREHVRNLRRRLPGLQRLVVQVDEPALPAVLAGSVPTASGFGRHRTVHPPEASEALEAVLGAIAGEDAEPWVHCCAADAPLPLLRDAGARGLSVDLGQARPAQVDALAAALEAGESVALGIVPALDPLAGQDPGDVQVTERVLRWLDLVGLDPATSGPQIVLTPACGLAGASHSWARRSFEVLRAAALNLT